MVLLPSTDGVRLAVHELGDPPAGARPLLLAHATGFHARVWDALADELADRRCLALDFRGFGDSTEPEGALDWWGFADDVLTVIDHYGFRDLQAVGHSMGGAALLMAELRRPGTFDRIVCFEPIVFPSDPARLGGPNPLADVTRHRRETFGSFEEAIERFSAKPPLGSLRPDVLQAYVRHGFSEQPDGSVRLKADREHEARTYEMSSHGAFSRLGEITCPVLVVASGDGGAPALVAGAVAGALAHGTLRVFEDLGHFGPLEDPARFGALVTEFFA